ncbi:helix-turn-helix domain-containing protein [Roseateles koreensis]|uniref:Helix-turn-helix transcriptional regulator n=1 Tax=Roseateles koreensis TaxID=2987526 RepID=A0ABT5KQY8_9BURK|nr:helix-turn-helix transcriptional regulator [Roseateles koreensis]MDC8784880.1 helix-turn-helix transcriptional regulator [Roseateles koreensis]
MPSLLQHANQAEQRATQILESLPAPLMVLRRDRHLLFTNRSADKMLEAGEAEQRAQHLMQVGQINAPKLEQVLHQAARGDCAQAALWFRGTLKTGWLHASRLPSDMARPNDWPDDSLLLLIQRDQPEFSQYARIEALCRERHISNAERQVLTLLASGLEVEATAAQLGVQISTVRTHVRHLLNKTQAHSLMQLVRWLGSSTSLPH